MTKCQPTHVLSFFYTGVTVGSHRGILQCDMTDVETGFDF